MIAERAGYDGYMSVRVKRIYEPKERGDGFRVLVDRLWPRGVRKEDAEIDLWAKELAPSDELRKWYGHDTDRFGEFRKRYKGELRASAKRERIEELARRARQRNVTVLTATKDVEHSNAEALAQVLEKELDERTSRSSGEN